MTEQKKQGQEPADASQELTAEQLEQVNGGVLIGLSQPSALPAVQKVREAAMGDGSVMPTDQFSLNFTKVR
jgi:hypothetical protein